MNCLDFRRYKLAQPRDLPAQASAHVEGCLACADFAYRIDRFESRLERAINVPVEPTLTERVLLNHRLRHHRRWRSYAAAAAMVIAVVGGGGVAYTIYAPERTLTAASVDHVLTEPVALIAGQDVSRSDLEQALALSGANLRVDMAHQVTYLHDCPVPGGMGKHLVIATAAGKFTIITMPDRPVNAREAADRLGLSVAVLPAAKGSYAIIANSRERLAMAETLIAQQVAWRS